MHYRLNKWAARAVVVGFGLATCGAGLDRFASAQMLDRGKATPAKKDAPVIFSADDVNYDDQLGIMVARGHVEITQNDRTLLADVVSYNERSNMVTASGNVSMIDASGEVVSGDYVELRNDMRDGFIHDVRILMSDHSRLAGNGAIRTDANRTELRKGVYSPCDLCASDPTSPPLWQIKADKVTHDKEAQRVEYENAIMEIDGYPILYSPYFSHPDPSVKRASGFLPPSFGSSNELGFNATIPYYWAISPTQDATFAPIFTSNQGVALAGQYRQAFSDGFIDLRGSVTQAEDDSIYDANAIDGQLRGNVSAKGQFDLDENFRLGFDIDRASDDTYERIYHFGGLESFLDSNVYLEDFQGRDYGSINTYAFQSLEADVTTKSQPFVLPVAQYTWNGSPQSWGGRFTSSVSYANILRETPSMSDLLTAAATPSTFALFHGDSSQRLTAQTRMDLPWKTPDGSSFNFMASARGDGYDVSNAVDDNTESYRGGQTERFFPQVGLEWKDPIARITGGSTFILTPRAAFYASTNGGNPKLIPNNDSQDIDFNETDLFTPNRFAGYDLVDGGQRVDYGLQGDWFGSGQLSSHFLVGQSYRLQKDDSIYIDGTGLSNQASDYVGRVSVSPSSYFDVSYRFRLDERDLRPHRQEVATSFGPQDVRFTLDYLQSTANPQDDVDNRQEVTGSVTLTLNDYWKTTGYITQEFSESDNNATMSGGVGAIYEDECLTFAASVSQSGARDRDIQPGMTILFQVVFKNLGIVNLPAFSAGGSTTTS